MQLRFRWIRALALASLGTVIRIPAQAGGQEGPPPPPQTVAAQGTGFSVTGRVTCADTQHPARFAQVTLLPANPSAEGGERRLNARTDLDGNFTINNAPAGDYYVTGSLSGYVNSASVVESALSAGTDPAAALAGIPLIHVSAGGAAAALNLQRGGVLSGTVTWDDGSPAGGVGVSAVVPSSTSASGSPVQSAVATGPRNGNFGGGANGTQTDDRGHFRISGLSPGTYLLRASIQAPAPQRADDRGFGRNLNISVYAPDKLRRTDALSITLAAGEEHADVNIVLGLAALHSVSGVVTSTSASVRSGTVNLTDQNDSTLNRTGLISLDGSFVVPYIPPGMYTLRVSASSQPPSFGRGGGNSGADQATRFQPVQISVTVADTDLGGLSVNVTAANASQ